MTVWAKLCWLIATGQIIWWFVWQEIGRTEAALTLSLATAVAFALIMATPDCYYRQLARRVQRRPKSCLLLLAALSLIFPLSFLSSPRHYTDGEALLAAAVFVFREGLSAYFSEYPSLDWLGDLHPPLVPILVAPWVGFWDGSMIPSAYAFLLLAWAGVFALFALGSALYGRKVAFMAALAMICFRGFWIYLAVPSLLVVVTLCGILSHRMCFRMVSSQKRLPMFWLGFGLAFCLGAGLYSEYLALALLPGVFAWTATPKARVFIWFSMLLSVLLFLPWPLRQFHEATTSSRFLHHIPAETTVSNSVRLSSYFTPGRAARTVGCLTSQGVGVLVLFAAFLLIFGRSLWDAPLIGWVLGYVLVILILPLSRYFSPALPALALVLGRGLAKIPDEWAFRYILLLLVCALLAAYQFPTVPYGPIPIPDLVP